MTELIAAPVLRSLLGAAARARAETAFTAPVVVEHYLRYYRASNADTFHDGAGM